MARYTKLNERYAEIWETENDFSNVPSPYGYTIFLLGTTITKYDSQVNSAINIAIRCRLNGFFLWMLNTNEFALSYSEPLQNLALNLAIEYRRPMIMIQILKHSESLGLQITRDEPCPLMYVYKTS